MKKYIIALDIGTTSSRALLYDTKQKRITGIDSVELDISFPELNFVEQDADAIVDAVYRTVYRVLQHTGAQGSEVLGLGITNQRETVVIWDKKSGKPVAPAISWQDRRTTYICKQFAPHEKSIRGKTGLVLDPYFSATKLKWMFDHITGLRARAEAGELLAGTLDTYLIWRLTGKRMHLTDMSNASRTQLFNINTLRWDEELIQLFDIPRQVLPLVSSSIGYFGEAVFEFGNVPILSAMGDQQSALFGQACFEQGNAKHTYGTGGFLLSNIGNTPIISEGSLLTTIAWFFGGEVTYALEGSIFNAGSVIQWVRDNLRLIKTAGESETAALSVSDNGGVYFVPAFGGLGAPYWDAAATGNISGINRGTTREHIVRAALESMAYGVHDLIQEFKRDDVDINRLKVDGGACINNFLLQFQSDILNTEITRQVNLESSAQGAIFAAALASGVFKSLGEIRCEIDRTFSPQMEENLRKKYLLGWAEAVEKSRLVLSAEQPVAAIHEQDDGLMHKTRAKTKKKHNQK